MSSVSMKSGNDMNEIPGGNQPGALKANEHN